LKRSNILTHPSRLARHLQDAGLDTEEKPQDMLRHSLKLLRASSFLTLLWIFSAVGWAQTPVGLRAGISGDPDQFYFGGHVESAPLIQEVHFRPNIEAGVGSDRTVIALNGEFIRRFGLNNNYAAYIGAGPAINITSFDAPVGGGDTRVDPGVNFLIGLDFPRGMFAELKVGAIDSPQVKFGVGYTFFP
jgi:hypothetical protein